MSENVKAFIKLHVIIYICFLVSILGLYVADSHLATIAFSVITIIIPLSLIISIFYVIYKEPTDA